MNIKKGETMKTYTEYIQYADEVCKFINKNNLKVIAILNAGCGYRLFYTK